MKKIHKDIYKEAFSLMCTARAMTNIYEKNKEFTSKYVHATSRGHEAIQLALGLQLTKIEIFNLFLFFYLFYKQLIS